MREAAAAAPADGGIGGGMMWMPVGGTGLDSVRVLCMGSVGGPPGTPGTTGTATAAAAAAADAPGGTMPGTTPAAAAAAAAPTLAAPGGCGWCRLISLYNLSSSISRLKFTRGISSSVCKP